MGYYVTKSAFQIRLNPIKAYVYFHKLILKNIQMITLYVHHFHHDLLY